MKWTICLTVLFSLFFYSSLFAQPGGVKISGSVTDSTGQVLSAVTVILLRSADSSTAKITSSDNSGIYAFDDIPPGHYLLSFSITGYTPHWIALPAIGASLSVDPVRLQRAAVLLEGVTVTAHKPLIELKPDRTVVNVDASVINVGATALEVLEKSPGVTVDRNGTISLKGKQNVLILMDGKPSYLSGADLANFLSGLSASQIELIEIMTNPSSKYDAAGNAGIINIKTKKNKVRGFNGNLNLSYGQGHYYKSNNSLLLNYRNGNYNLYLTYGANISRYFTDIYAYRWYYGDDNKTVTNRFEQPTYITNPFVNHNFKTGIDYFPGKKTTLGFAVNGLYSERKTIGTSSGDWINNNNQIDSTIHTSSDNKSAWKNLGFTVSGKHTFF